MYGTFTSRACQATFPNPTRGRRLHATRRRKRWASPTRQGTRCMDAQSLALWMHRNNVHRFFFCPECGIPTATPEELGPHIERHRPPEEPSDEAPLLCAKGCGRLFSPFGKGKRPPSLREHEAICDGKPPLTASYDSRPKLDPVSCMQIAVTIGREAAGKIAARYIRTGILLTKSHDPSADETLVRWLLYGHLDKPAQSIVDRGSSLGDANPIRIKDVLPFSPVNRKTCRTKQQG